MMIFNDGLRKILGMIERYSKSFIYWVGLLLIFVFEPFDLKGQNLKNPIPESIDELRIAIIEILKESNTPAAGIALVDSSGPLWIEGIGMADVEKGIKADEETMFRIASTSKIFVSLAILKLEEESKIRLKDRVKEIIPEIEFNNPWEQTDPILIEHLLEHTTGWDDIHLPEQIFNEPDITLNEALEFHPHSRISKWVPGTRMAYANSGPAVAAYIVEKITKQTFEDYVRENFFLPMEMETMTYFYSEDFRRKGATQYKNGKPQAYWHIIIRPSGSINASPKDMAKMLELFIQRGKVKNKNIISKKSITRMETPSTTLGAKAGLKYGYGLGLYTSSYKDFTYYKHGGSTHGGKSDFSYLPDFGVGYAVQINSDDLQVIRKISALIRSYQTAKLSTTKKEKVSIIEKSGGDLNGYYHQINPIKQTPYYLPSLLVERIWTVGDTLYNQIPAFIGQKIKFVKVNNLFYHNLETDRMDFVLVNDPLEGEVLELAGVESGTVTLGPISPILVLGRIGVLLLWIVFIIHSLSTLPFWIYFYIKRRVAIDLKGFIRLWPILPIGILISVLFLLNVASFSGKEALAQPSFVSISIMLGSILFFIGAIMSFVIIICSNIKGIKKRVYIPATILSFLHSLVAIYLFYHGVIGLMTWE